MFSPNVARNHGKTRHWYEATVPLNAQLILLSVKEDRAEQVNIWQGQIDNLEGRSLFSRLRLGLYKWKQSQAQQDLDATAFIADGTLEVSRLFTENDLPIVQRANKLIQANLPYLDGLQMSPDVLATSAAIRVSTEPVPYLDDHVVPR